MAGQGFMKRLLRVLGALMLALGLMACQQGESSDPTAQACQAYVRAFADNNTKAMNAALNRMGQLASNVDQPDDSRSPVLDPDIYLVLLTNGPPPWAPIHYEFLNEACTKFLGGTPAGSPTQGFDSAETGPNPEDRAAIASTIRDRLDSIIAEKNLPYEVLDSRFEEAGPEASEVNLPEGTIWWVVFKDPLRSINEITNRSLFYDPLEAYAESLRPEFESGQLDFVVTYFLAWHNPSEDVFLIPPFVLRLYLEGQIGVKELTKKMVILTGPVT